MINLTKKMKCEMFECSEGPWHSILRLDSERIDDPVLEMEEVKCARCAQHFILSPGILNAEAPSRNGRPRRVARLSPVRMWDE